MTLMASIIPVRKGETVQEWVYHALRRIIMAGQITPGQALTIRGLAADLEVSAMPVREALRRLTSEGALEMKANRRIVVPAMTPSLLSELLEMRVALETLAAERAMPYVNQEIIQRLEDLDTRLNEALSNNDTSGIILTNQAFHRTLYQTNPHDASMPFVERIWLQLGPLHRLALTWLADQKLDDRHVDIIKALKRHDSIGLKAAVEADIREAAGYLSQQHLLRDYLDGGDPFEASAPDYGSVFRRNSDD